VDRGGGLTDLVDLLVDSFLRSGGPVELVYSRIHPPLPVGPEWSASYSLSCPETDPRSDYRNLGNMLVPDKWPELGVRTCVVRAWDTRTRYVSLEG
jgi:hypothetical protein